VVVVVVVDDIAYVVAAAVDYTEHNDYHCY
jgi:hypothetical protein